MKLQPVRGTHDLFAGEIRRHQFIGDKARQVSARFGFEELRTPIFEFAQVFNRTLGEASDIVSKEMYTFTDKSGDTLCLRPEGTAGIVRAFISNGWVRNVPFKVFYEGPMFRYERPQKGRYRQFHQIGLELIGVTDPAADVEIIAAADLLLSELGIRDLAELEINSLGDGESRKRYREALVKYFSENISKLSTESQKRLETNPLRILDSKDEKDIAVCVKAPRLQEYLNEVSQNILSAVESGLSALGIKYSLNPRLVRGLDYYTHVVFEYRTKELGTQDAILAGGRYDGLVELMGGPSVPGVGWAAGMERLSLLLKNDPPVARPIAVIPISEGAMEFAYKLSFDLRVSGFNVEMSYSGNMSNRLKKATRANSRTAIIIGDDELAQGTVTLKYLDAGTQEVVKVTDLVVRLKK